MFFGDGFDGDRRCLLVLWLVIGDLIYGDVFVVDGVVILSFGNSFVSDCFACLVLTGNLKGFIYEKIVFFVYLRNQKILIVEQDCKFAFL